MTRAGPASPPTSFACLWCGQAWTVRGPDDLEGWARLCPDCLGKAGENEFLRFRLHQALEARAAATRLEARAAATRHAAHEGVQPQVADAAPATARRAEAPAAPDAAEAQATPDTLEPPTQAVEAPAGPTGTTSSSGHSPTIDQAMIDYYEARAPEYDDWYLRRGRYERGPIHDNAWNAELDAAGRWLDGLPLRGRIVELAAGTGWWSPLLAAKTTNLWMFDAAEGPLERARDRLVAHGLRAHLHVRDAWAPPDGDPADALFAGFWLSHVPRERTSEFLELARDWLRPGGRLAIIDSLADPASSAVDHPEPADDLSLRRLNDGREFTIVKVFRAPAEIASALSAAGFRDVEVTTTGRFFVLVTAIRG